MSDPVVIELRSPRKIEGLPTGSPQELHVKTRFSGHILEMEDINFYLDSAVLLPDYGPDAPQPGTADQNRITGLGVLYACYKQAVTYPDQALLVAGHTDRSGPSAYNLALSELRAQNVLAVLKGDREAWAAISQGRHKVEDYQQILKWIAYTWEWNCDPGEKTGKDNEQTRTAIENFQRQYNIELDAFIPINGKVGSETWGAFFDIYMRELMTLLATNKAGLESYRSKLKFIKGRPECVGCGEFFPITKDRNKTEIDRRVELLFFDPGEEPELKCHPEPGKCRHKECDLYGNKLYSFSRVECKPPVPAPPSSTHTIRIVDVDTPHFIPSLEELTITYEITGPMGRIQNIKLVAESEKEPGRRLFEKDLGIPASPASSVVWKGEATDPAFDGFLNLAASPYQVWMVLTTLSGTSAESNKGKVSVIPEAIEIFVDDKGPATIDDSAKTIIADLMDSIAKNKGKGVVVLPSAIFKTDSTQMNNDLSFQLYKTKWRRGVSIPLYARIWLKGKDGKRKRVAQATAGTKVLWDVALETDAEFNATLKGRSLDKPAMSFVQQVTAYKKTATEPQGRTAHKYFGGQRTTNADRGADELQWVKINDDWNALAPSQRTWGSHSLCKTTRAFDAETGICFACSRMAGDVHTVSAYIDTDGTPDTKDDKALVGIPAAKHSNAITFTTRRQISVVQSYKVGKGTTDVDLSTMTREYDKAAMTFDAAPGLAVQEVQASWRTAYQKVIAQLSKTDNFVRDAALTDPELYPVKYKSFNDYWDHTHPKSGKVSKLFHRLFSFLQSADEETYRKECDKHAYRIYYDVVQSFPLGEKGLTIFKFGENGDHNMWKGSFTAGIAPSIPKFTGIDKTMFLIFESGKADRILVHEVGHQVFLAHAPGHFDSGDSRTAQDAKGNKITQPDGFQPNAHADNQWCVMSYHKSDPKELCGLCILKLSGWNYTKINMNGTIS